MNRTHTNGELRLCDAGKEVTLIGWVAKRRNFGSLVFIDLRDRTGITQLVFDEQLSEQIRDVRNEYILEATGCVMERKDKNPKLPTGEIEIQVRAVTIINRAETTPIIVADETDALEDTRLKYRYLDLRRPVMQQKLMLRHRATRAIISAITALSRSRRRCLRSLRRRVRAIIWCQVVYIREASMPCRSHRSFISSY